jgi:hypothetical protein
VLESRILGRQRAGSDASEADLSVLAWQESQREAIAPEEGLRVIDADTTEGDIVLKVCAMLSQSASGMNGWLRREGQEANHSTRP